ncbi:MAG: hypothetical protein ACLRFL_02360 [Clostridia bacterium]
MSNKLVIGLSVFLVGLGIVGSFGLGGGALGLLSVFVGSALGVANYVLFSDVAKKDKDIEKNKDLIRHTATSIDEYEKTAEEKFNYLHSQENTPKFKGKHIVHHENAIEHEEDDDLIL